MRILRYPALYFLMSIALMFVAVGSPAKAVEAEQPPEFLSQSPLIISAYSVVGEQPRYVELYNNGNQPLKATEWSVSLKWSLTKDAPIGAIAPEIDPIRLYPANDDNVPYIPPGGYVVMGFNNAVTNALSNVTLSGLSPSVFIGELNLHHASYRPYVRTLTEAQAVNDGTKRLNVGATGYTTTYGDVNKDRVYQDEDYYYAPSGNFPVAPIEILANPKTCSPLDKDSSCLEYVKFYNNIGSSIDFAGTRLRAGSLVTSLSGKVESGQYAIFAVSLPNAGGYVSLEDRYGIHTYKNTVIEYADASAVSKKGKSWALLGQEWGWAVPSPSGANTPLSTEEPGKGSVSTLKPCRDDQYRNPETNRCKLIAASASSLKPCTDNQYRSLETNRCRNIAAASSSSALKPCAANQYRNPETNRCRLIASTTNSLKPCIEGQERNPETNRCRKASNSNVPEADFPVEKIRQQANDTIGWLAFAGVGSMAAGYGAWEWRRELGGLFGKIMGLLKK